MSLSQAANNCGPCARSRIPSFGRSVFERLSTKNMKRKSLTHSKSTGLGRPPPPPPPPSLWDTAIDPASGHPYYVNRITGESSWEKHVTTENAATPYAEQLQSRKMVVIKRETNKKVRQQTKKCASTCLVVLKVLY